MVKPSMNKWLMRAVILNAMLLLIYIYFDYYTWTIFPVNLESIDLGIRANATMKVFSESTYSILVRNFRVMAQHLYEVPSMGTSGSWYIQSSATPNFPLFVFIVALAINLYLVWMMSKEDTS